jgi:hypothetical protein
MCHLNLLLMPGKAPYAIKLQAFISLILILVKDCL